MDKVSPNQTDSGDTPIPDLEQGRPRAAPTESANANSKSMALSQDELKDAGIKQAKKKMYNGGNKTTMTTEEFEKAKPYELRKDIRMIAACKDRQTSADVFDVSSFQLPDPAGRAGGACTSALLSILYADEKVPEDDLSFTEVLQQMRAILKEEEYSQTPQLSSMNPINVDDKFDLVPDTATGTKRAVMIGINYVGEKHGELRGCWNDVLNMKKYIQDVYGFEEENIVILMDDGNHIEPTKENIIDAYKTVVAQAEENDAIFLHYSGHGTKLRDNDGDERDGYDEALVPLDFQSSDMIRDDDLYDLLIKNLPDGVHMVSVMDCCHSGTILDLPYLFKGDGKQREMTLDPNLNLEAFIEKITGKLLQYLQAKLAPGLSQ